MAIRVRAMRDDVVLRDGRVLPYGSEDDLRADEAHELYLRGEVDFVADGPAVETADLPAVESRGGGG